MGKFYEAQKRPKSTLHTAAPHQKMYETKKAEIIPYGGIPMPFRAMRGLRGSKYVRRDTASPAK